MAKLSHKGGQEVKRLLSLEEWAVYVRRGAVLPLWEEAWHSGGEFRFIDVKERDIPLGGWDEWTPSGTL